MIASRLAGRWGSFVKHPLCTQVSGGLIDSMCYVLWQLWQLLCPEIYGISSGGRLPSTPWKATWKMGSLSKYSEVVSQREGGNQSQRKAESQRAIGYRSVRMPCILYPIPDFQIRPAITPARKEAEPQNTIDDVVPLSSGIPAI